MRHHSHPHLILAIASEINVTITVLDKSGVIISLIKRGGESVLKGMLFKIS